jgi:hypothetical protein
MPCLPPSDTSDPGPEAARVMSIGSLPLRVLLAEQGFVIIHQHLSKLELETPSVRRHINHADCPECHGAGHVPQHGGLRQKTCSRCGGRGWIIRATSGR